MNNKQIDKNELKIKAIELSMDSEIRNKFMVFFCNEYEEHFIKFDQMNHKKIIPLIKMAKSYEELNFFQRQEVDILLFLIEGLKIINNDKTINYKHIKNNFITIDKNTQQEIQLNKMLIFLEKSEQILLIKNLLNDLQFILNFWNSEQTRINFFEKWLLNKNQSNNNLIRNQQINNSQRDFIKPLKEYDKIYFIIFKNQ